MWRHGIWLAALCLAVVPCAAASASKTKHRASKPVAGKNTAPKKSAPKSGPSTAESKRAAASAHSGRRKSTKYASARRRTAKKPQHHWVQQAPTQDRYREIQQALADKGYFKGTVDGHWGTDSVAALRSFQQEHNLDGDGKLTSLSLIGLGLGPNRAAIAKTETGEKQ